MRSFQTMFGGSNLACWSPKNSLLSQMDSDIPCISAKAPTGPTLIWARWPKMGVSSGTPCAARTGAPLVPAARGDARGSCAMSGCRLIALSARTPDTDGHTGVHGSPYWKGSTACVKCTRCSVRGLSFVESVTWMLREPSITTVQRLVEQIWHCGTWLF